MNLSFYIARRYLFSKKSHNAINVISMISACGIAIATMALVCTLSVFNGFTDVVVKTFSNFDPDLQITATKGKVFDASDPKIEQLKALQGIALFSESIEENALLKFEDRQVPVLIKGVSPQFNELADMDKLLLDGEFVLKQGDIEYGVIGAGLAMTLGVRANFIAPLEIYSPKRDVKINLANPSTAFTKSYAYTSGVFALNQPKYDDQMLLVSLDLARELFRYDKEISTLDIRLKKGASVSDLKKEIKAILGDGFTVKDQFEQQEESYRMVNIEKWVTFLILAFILVIAVFNVVGSLSMLIIEKAEDIKILQNMGANRQLITRIFAIEGWLITMLGAGVGLILGLLLCLLQQYFGILKLGDTPGAFIIDAYPVVVEPLDILFIFLTVSFISFIAVLYPINNLKKRL